MEEKIKEIVSVFIKVPAGDIGSGTPVDRAAVQSSILLHRMYARLAEEGFVYENYSAIKVFGELQSSAAAVVSDGVAPERTDGPARTSGPERTPGLEWTVAPEMTAAPERTGGPARTPGLARTDGPAIGIDIEAVSSLPRTTDFRAAEFYRMNFSAEEIAYCILQPDAYASFAGLFSAKEAIVKADEQSRSKPFNTLAIRHSAEGRPYYPGFNLSISHANEMAVAVAVRMEGMPWRQAAAPLVLTPATEKKSTSASPIAWLALLLGLAALLITLLH